VFDDVWRPLTQADAPTRNLIGQSIGIEGLSWTRNDQDLSSVVFTLSSPYNFHSTNSNQDIFSIDGDGIKMTTIHAIVKLEDGTGNNRSSLGFQ
jgi:hypothetical protein